jgi:hypothetical protein
MLFIKEVSVAESTQHGLVHHFYCFLKRVWTEAAFIASFSSSVKLYMFIVAQSEVTEIITPDY